LAELLLERPLLHLVDEVERAWADLGLVWQGNALRHGGGSGERKCEIQGEKASGRHEGDLGDDGAKEDITMTL
jgi:hypothetical protein